ncbi:MAG TPA: hypothetical protein VGW35_10595 [Methylomirabilota bacterium]|jgi:hypothetical protein|nr:hypothetical protein [Methylomirabilota bacterium]
MGLTPDAHSPFPNRRPLTEPLEHVIEGGPWDQALPSGRARRAGSLEPSTVTRAIEDLERSGYRPLHAPSEARSRAQGLARVA